MKARTRHQLHHMLVGFKEDYMYIFRVSFFQLLLQVATAMLVLAQSIDFALEML